MSRPTIASLEAENLKLRMKIANVEDYLTELDPNDWCVDKDEIVEQVAEYLDIEVSKYQDVIWNITVRGRVKTSKDTDLNDLDLTVRGETVSCSNVGVDGYEYTDMEIEVDSVYYD